MCPRDLFISYVIEYLSVQLLMVFFYLFNLHCIYSFTPLLIPSVVYLCFLFLHLSSQRFVSLITFFEGSTI